MKNENLQAGKLEIEELSLVNYNGEVLDLQTFIYGFDVYEDIMSQTMSATLYMNDGNALIERLPIIGDERVYMKFKSPLLEEFFENWFHVYKISNRSKVNDNSETYSIELVSYPFLRSQWTTSDRAYTGFFINDIVDRVYKLIHDPVEQLRKPLVTTETIGKHSFVAPEYTPPLEFINLLASEARSKKYPDNSAYVFYEDRNQFNFKSISDLFEGQAVRDYYYSVDNLEQEVGDNNQIFPEQIIETLEYQNMVDIVKQADMGMYDNVITVIDPIFKQKKDYTFVYENEFDKLSSINLIPNKVISPLSARKDNDGSSHSRLFVGNLSEGNYYQTSYLKSRCTPVEPLSFFPSQRHRFMNKKIALQASLNNVSLNIKTKGASNLKAGDIINVYVPMTTNDERIAGDYNPFFGDIYTQARFLIMRINHHWDAGEGLYSNHIKIVKDSFATEIISEGQLAGGGG